MNHREGNLPRRRPAAWVLGISQLMQRLREFWTDESGVVISAELALLATLVVAGGVVGLTQVSAVMNAELQDLAGAFRGLDQGYSVRGFRGARAFTAGSSFRQAEPGTSSASTAPSISLLCALAAEAEPDEPPREWPPTRAEEKLGQAR